MPSAVHLLRLLLVVRRGDERLLLGVVRTRIVSVTSNCITHIQHENQPALSSNREAAIFPEETAQPFGEGGGV
jgi:hypothetical protein